MNMTDKPINFEINKDYSNKEYQAKDIQRYLIDGGDIGFNPDKNKAIVEGTLRHNWSLFRKRAMDYRAKLHERVEATAYYMSYLNSGKSGNAERYFGRRELARLRGIEFAREQKNVTRIQVDGYYKQKGVWSK